MKLQLLCTLEQREPKRKPIKIEATDHEALVEECKDILALGLMGMAMQSKKGEGK